MGRILGSVKALTIEANVSPCAHICRYCSIGDRGPKFSFERWLALVDRFLDWAKENSHQGIKVQGGFYPSYNFDLETFIRLRDWHKRKLGLNMNGVALGGLRMRSDDDMRRWLTERQAVGLESVGATFVGCGTVHDRWNGRRGDFDFLIRTLLIAAELGLKHNDQHLLTKSSLPLLRETIERLDALPTPHNGRYVRIPYYIGHGAHREAERITEDNLENLPPFVSESLPKEWNLRSEREWIEVVLGETETPRDISLRLELNANNIDYLEAMSCEEIFLDLENHARTSLTGLPSRRELADTYGDRNSTKIYLFPADLDRVWLYRFLEANPMEFDWSLLHYHLGRSMKPPRLLDLA